MITQLEFGQAQQIMCVVYFICSFSNTCFVVCAVSVFVILNKDCFLKISGVLSKNSISDICYYFGLLSADEAICVRQDRFRNRYSATEHGICCVFSKY